MFKFGSLSDLQQSIVMFFATPPYRFHSADIAFFRSLAPLRAKYEVEELTRLGWLNAEREDDMPLAFYRLTHEAKRALVEAGTL